MSQPNMKVVYSIHRNKEGTRTFWTRIGVAFVNQDGSLNVVLNCLPVDGKMHIRDYVPRDLTPTGEPPRDGNQSFDELPF